MVRDAIGEIGKKRSPEAIRQRKRAVLDVAAAEFARNGYSDADMDRIAEGARVGKGTIYRYYASKEKLFEAVADDAMNQLRDFVFSRLERAEREGPEGPVDRLKLSGRAFLEFFDEKQPLLEVFLRGGRQFMERLELSYLELYEANIHIIRNLLDECVSRGFARDNMDTRELADTVGDMLVGLVYMWGVRRDTEPLSRKWPMVEAIILNGVLV